MAVCVSLHLASVCQVVLARHLAMCSFSILGVMLSECWSSYIILASHIVLLSQKRRRSSLILAALKASLLLLFPVPFLEQMQYHGCAEGCNMERQECTKMSIVSA